MLHTFNCIGKVCGGVWGLTKMSPLALLVVSPAPKYVSLLNMNLVLGFIMHWDNTRYNGH